jgi:hypothetical protein
MATEDSQRSDQQGVSLEDAMQAVVRAAIANLHTALPGIVQSFDAKTQTARVTPAIKRIWLDDGPKALPDCVDVPVQFTGGGEFVVTWPVRQGDECLLVFSERAIDKWFARGGVQEPATVAFHDLSDAFALMGFRSKPHAVGGVSGDGLEIRTLDGQTMFRLENNSAFVGGVLGAVAALMGEPHQQAEATLVTGLIAAFSALAAASTGPLAGLAAGFTAAGTALTQFQTAATAQQNFLARKAKVV